MAKYRGKHVYLGAWGYVLYDILYAIPVLGFICLLAHSFDANNENRKYYARSYFARLLLVVILCAVAVGIVLLTVDSAIVQTKVTEVQTMITDFITQYIPSVPNT